MEVTASGTIEHESRNPTVMKGRLPISFADFVEIEKLVQPHIGQEVQAAVEEGEQPEHAAVADQHGHAQQLAQRRDGQRDHQEAQGPIAGEVGDEFDGVGAQILLPGAPAQPGQRRQAQQEYQNLGPARIVRAWLSSSSCRSMPV